MAMHRKTRRRFEFDGELRFLTFSCYKRLQLFNNASVRDRFVERLCDVQEATGFSLAAWVVMPEHIHLLLMPDLPAHPVSMILDELKGPFAKEVLHRWRELDAPILPRLLDSRLKSHFWQEGGGYDRNIVTAQEAEEKFNYIHNNPVARRLVDKPTDWRWSSAHWYAHGFDDWGLRMSPGFLV